MVKKSFFLSIHLFTLVSTSIFGRLPDNTEIENVSDPRMRAAPVDKAPLPDVSYL